MDKGEQAGGATPGVLGPKALEELLITLRRSSKDLAFYPSGHPLLNRSLERAVRQFDAVVSARPPVTLAISRAGFSFEGRPFGAQNRQLAAMAADLVARRIRRIVFSEGVEQEELTAFLRMLAGDPKLLFQQGGPGKVLADQGVRRIQVNVFEFEHVGAPGATQKTAVAEETLIGGADGTGTGQETATLDAFRSSARSREENTVEALLHRLEREAAAGRLEGYEKTVARLETKVIEAIPADRLVEVVAILQAFLLHRQAENLEPPIRERAARAVETVTGGDTLAYLVERLGSETGGSEGTLAALLLGLGARVIPRFLTRLATRDQGSERAILLATLARFRLVALPDLAGALKGVDQRVACDLAAVLGEIADEASVSLLGRLAWHREAWVRAEAVRALGGIGREAAYRLLVQSLRDPNLDVRELAIGFLAAARARQATPALLQFARQRTLVGRPFALRKAAIAALGAVGDPGSVSVLAALLSTRTWFRRAAGEQLRRAAAKALLGMARPETREVVEAGTRSRRSDVRRACAAALAAEQVAVHAPAPD